MTSNNIWEDVDNALKFAEKIYKCDRRRLYQIVKNGNEVIITIRDEDTFESLKDAKVVAVKFFKKEGKIMAMEGFLIMKDNTFAPRTNSEEL